MLASNFFIKDKAELIAAIHSTKSSLETNVLLELEQIENYFQASANMEYNDFLIDYKLKYGNFIEQYRERNKVIAINTIKIAAIIYIVSSIIFFVGMIVYFAS